MEQRRFVRKNIAIYDAQRRQEKKRNRRKVFYVFLFLSVSLVFLAVCAAVFLDVQEIQIIGNERYATDEISQLVSINVGDNIFSFDADEIETAIASKYPYIHSVEVKRDLPSTVIIEITEDTEFYKAELAGEIYILSPEMKVLRKLTEPQTEDSAEPSEEQPEDKFVKLTLNNAKRCIVGNPLEFVDARTYDAILELQDRFTENGISSQVIEIDIRSRFDIYINYQNRFRVYLGDMEDIEIKIRFLVGIIDELEDGATGTIDISNPQEAAVALT